MVNKVWVRHPDEVVWIGRTTSTVKPSKTSVSIRWSAMVGVVYPAVSPSEDLAMKTLITNELFSDFVECRYRGYLRLTGATGSKSDLVDESGRFREDYHTQAREHLLRLCRNAGKRVCTDVDLSVVLANRYDRAIDVTKADSTTSVRFDALMAAPGNVSGSPDYIPIIFVNNNKVSEEDELLLGRVLRLSLARMLVDLRSEGFFMAATSG